MTRIKSIKTSGIEKVGEKIEDLVVLLTKDEVLERGKQLAEAESKIAEFDFREKAAKSRFKAEREELEAGLRNLARVVRDESEVRSVRVEIVKDYAAGTLSEIRIDTGAVIYSRELATAERQAGLFEDRHDA